MTQCLARRIAGRVSGAGVKVAAVPGAGQGAPPRSAAKRVWPAHEYPLRRGKENFYHARSRYPPSMKTPTLTLYTTDLPE